RLHLRERFGQDLPVLRLHSDRGGEFSSTLLREFCRGKGILQSFMLPDSPQQNRIAERRFGLVMELNLWPRVSLPKTSPTLLWTGEVGDASVFRVLGSRAFVLLPPHLALCLPFSGRHVSRVGSLLPSLPLPLCSSPAPAALPCSRSPSSRPPPAARSCSLRCVSSRPSPGSCACSGSCQLRCS
ncbi:unnamed protein product, partial [Closterium sp. NIES-53]